jgi:hypothetical protein
VEVPMYVASAPSRNRVGVERDVREDKVVKFMGTKNVIEERDVIFKFEYIVITSNKFLSPF